MLVFETGYLPGWIETPGRRRVDNRLFADAILRMAANAACRRDLPVVFGGWTVVHARFRPWSHPVVRKRLFHTLANVSDFAYVPDRQHPFDSSCRYRLRWEKTLPASKGFVHWEFAMIWLSRMQAAPGHLELKYTSLYSALVAESGSAMMVGCSCSADGLQSREVAARSGVR
ncbi:transposase [Gluconacetobacter aggeris]|uniref:Transposase n=1 Tax=Gluconacetobacter aggeris TaxID=1286186 RepID=A0A7W4ISQ3_9PROT|nr:transposase [Gluconacetobacter aggeris]